jgi:hypothetical protein
MGITGVSAIERKESNRVFSGKLTKYVVAPDLAAGIGRNQPATLDPKNLHE